ncbi:hypothetical protein [Hyphomicrobium sp. 99]|uniref:hypothetical protein n=1 Tax=Hyphomicrobium sp. 99 TaxID=1163419 RepID=UPI0005F82F80|nr:hypothetical protein [Hyphomicrobium sp. 99]
MRDIGGGFPGGGGDGGGANAGITYTLKVQLAGRPRPNMFYIAGGEKEVARLRGRVADGGIIAFNTLTHSIAVNLDHALWVNFLEDYGTLKGTGPGWKLPIDNDYAVGMLFAGHEKPVVVAVDPDANSPVRMKGKKIPEHEFDNEGVSGWNFLMHFMIDLDVYGDSEVDDAFLSFPDIDGETFHVNVDLLQLAVIPFEIEGNHDCIEEKPKRRSPKKK